jgi:ubiquinone biosynthesis monooxygenase Coq7
MILVRSGNWIGFKKATAIGRSTLPAPARMPSGPAKGAKFYSTGCCNAILSDHFSKITGLTYGVAFHFIFRNLQSTSPKPGALRTNWVAVSPIVVIIAPMNDRRLTPFDHVLSGLDYALRTVNSAPTRAARPNPADGVDEGSMTDAEKAHAAGLMRVNHAGEIAAQGLYQGHAAVARDTSIEEQMKTAASEELDHLAWCEQRLSELGAAPSALRPFWYVGSFAIGAASGALGDKWSLGFIEETERQVSEHLSGHLDGLPEQDARSRAIVAQMRDEEEEHGANAHEAGAAELPLPVRELMRVVARVMKGTAYWI